MPSVQSTEHFTLTRRRKAASASGRRCRAAILAALLAASGLSTAQSATFDVHLQPKKFTLYKDPYNGNEIKVGGFSGLFPAPGKHDSFYVITDRGPAPDFTDTDGTAYKTWLVPSFGAHIITVRLSPSGKGMIEQITPLTRLDGAPITGLPTTKPATDVPYDVDLNSAFPLAPVKGKE